MRLPPRPSRRPLSPRLRLERLEDRAVPATSTWIGGAHLNAVQTQGDPNAWSNPLNWLGGVPGSGDTAVFTGSVAFSLSNPNNPSMPVSYTGPFNKSPVVDIARSGVTVQIDATGLSILTVNQSFSTA